jgi:hypothetical protein
MFYVLYHTKKVKLRKEYRSWAQWLKPVIPVTQVVEIRKIKVGVQPKPKVCETPLHPIKAGHGGVCLSAQPCEKPK